MRYPLAMSAILFLMLRIRRLIVSTLQCRRSAISMMDNPSARRLSIVFSSSVKPHSAISRSRNAVGNCSLHFRFGCAISFKASIVTAYQSFIDDIGKVCRCFVNAVYPAKFFDGCSHQTASVLWFTRDIYLLDASTFFSCTAPK